MYYLHSLENLYQCIFGKETRQQTGEREASALTALLPVAHRETGQAILYLNGRFVWRACDTNYDIGGDATNARKVIASIVYLHAPGEH